MTGGLLDFPFGIDERGRIATTDGDDHVRDMIFQVLFTNPGERVNRPDFGCGLSRLAFEPNSRALGATTNFLVQGALEQWLGDVIQVNRVAVEIQESRLVVNIAYTRIATGERHEATFSSGGSG